MERQHKIAIIVGAMVVVFAVIVGIIFSSKKMMESAQSAPDVATVQTETAETEAETETAETAATQAEAESAAADETASDQVASGSEMTTVENVVEEGMEPIYADALNDGTYEIEVASSSSMFQITAATLTVANGEMNCVMTMGGTGYLYLYMGTGEEAAAADESAYIPFEENAAGEHTFTVPVEALDAGIDCAAFSKKKEKWYDRTLCFKMASLPEEALKEGVISKTTVEDLGVADGTYTIEVVLEGGSGKASVDSPTTLVIEGGAMTATITFSSPNYDYMMVNGEKYLTVNTEGNSTFEIPVDALDYDMQVSADTTAMSTPHEIEYTLHFDSSTLTAQE